MSNIGKIHIFVFKQRQVQLSCQKYNNGSTIMWWIHQDDSNYWSINISFQYQYKHISQHVYITPHKGLAMEIKTKLPLILFSIISFVVCLVVCFCNSLLVLRILYHRLHFMLRWRTYWCQVMWKLHFAILYTYKLLNLQVTLNFMFTTSMKIRVMFHPNRVYCYL